MTDKKETIKIGITTSILNFVAMLSIILTVFDSFFGEEYYRSTLLILVALIASVASGMLMCFIKRKWILIVAVFVLSGLFIWSQPDKIIGGGVFFINKFIEDYGKYMGMSFLYVDYTYDMLENYDVTAFIYLITVVLSFVNAFFISKRGLIWISLVLVFAALMAPVIIEDFPSAFAMILSIVYIIMSLVIAKSDISDFYNRKIVHNTALIFGTGLLIIVGTISVFKPKDEFEQNEFFPDFRENIRSFITERIENIKFFDGKNMASTLGGGALGHIDSLEFSNEPVLKVTLPAKKETIYIKGYVGGEYTSDNWKPIKNKDEELFETLVENNCIPAGMVAEYLDLLANDNTLTGIKGLMKIESLALIDLYEFAPIYSVVTEDIAPSDDGVIKGVSEDVFFEYYSVPDEVFKVSEDYIKSIQTNPDYLTYMQMYEEYVYEHYLEVNTTIEEQLREKWGEYPIDTATQRYEVANKIRNYLRDNCRYTLSPGKTPANKDFVEYFLNETHEGYCTYFATAAVMMFRSAGIPARYVEGYSYTVTGYETIVDSKNVSIFEGTEKNVSVDYCEALVKDNDAHAWVEFYIDGIGWIDYEVTPGNGTIGRFQETDEYNMNPENFGKEEEPDEPTTEVPSTSEADTTENNTTTADKESSGERTTANTTETKSHHSPTGNGGKDSTGSSFKNIGNKVIIVIGVILGIILLMFTVMFLLIVRRKKVTDRNVVYRNNEKALDKLAMYEYEYFTSLMKYIKLDRRDYMTHTEYAKYVVQTCEFVNEEEAELFADIQEKAEYARDLLSMDDINKCRQYNEAIRDRIYQSRGTISKFIFRYIYIL